MRRDSTQPDVVFSAYVPTEVLREFKNLLPIVGARTWVVENGLEKFLDLMESSPTLYKEATGDIQRMLSDDAPHPVETANMRLRSDLYERFNKLFPEYGAATWFWRRFLISLNERLRTNTTIEELIDLSVRTMSTEFFPSTNTENAVD